MDFTGLLGAATTTDDENYSFGGPVVCRFKMVESFIFVSNVDLKHKDTHNLGIKHFFLMSLCSCCYIHLLLCQDVHNGNLTILRPMFMLLCC